VVGIVASSHSQVATSDTFSGGDVADIGGRVTDRLLGGSALTWAKSNADSIHGITSGRLVKSAATSQQQITLEAGNPNVRVTATFVALPSSGAVRMFARAATATATTYYAVAVSATTATLAKVLTGTSSGIAAAVAIVAGDVIALELVGSTIRLLVNGVVASEVTDTDITSGGFVGFRNTTAGATGWQIDNLTVTEST